jgi:hypothetical protein
MNSIHLNWYICNSRAQFVPYVSKNERKKGQNDLLRLLALIAATRFDQVTSG